MIIEILVLLFCFSPFLLSGFVLRRMMQDHRAVEDIKYEANAYLHGQAGCYVMIDDGRVLTSNYSTQGQVIDLGSVEQLRNLLVPLEPNS